MPRYRDWLQQLYAFAQQPDLGCVGGGLCSPFQTFYHCGYAVSVPGGAVSYHAGVNAHNRPYRSSYLNNREVSAVSSCCLAIRRELFLQLGGFPHWDSDLASVALGLSAIEKGFTNLYGSRATMTVPTWHRPHCLRKAAPLSDLKRLEERFPTASLERWYSPLFEKDHGWLLPDCETTAPDMDDILAASALIHKEESPCR